MALVKCLRSTRLPDERHTWWLMANAFWLAGEKYELDYMQAVELFRLLPDAFEPLDEVAERAREKAAKEQAGD